MKYSLDKYRFYQAGNKVIAVSTYAGKAVRGVAKTDPSDEFDFEKGKKLAAARCNAKISKKRARRAQMKVQEAYTAYVNAVNYYNKMIDYYNDATEAFDKATIEMITLEDSM